MRNLIFSSNLRGFKLSREVANETLRPEEVRNFQT